MTFSDDSERRRLESELRQLTAELAEAERRKTELSTPPFAHELRNPLAPIRNALYVMRKVSDNATSMAQLRADEWNANWSSSCICQRSTRYRRGE